MEMLRDKVCEVFYKVQQGSSCHQKYEKILINLYNSSNLEDFEIEFMRNIEILFYQDVSHKNSFAERAIEFAANFIVHLVESNKKGTEMNESTDYEHPFLNTVICNVLNYHNLDNVSFRYRSCQFINLVLKGISGDAQIDAALWDDIENAMLERIKDVKPIIRIQAIKALVRLQTPTDSECPVVKAFLEHLYDSNGMVRRQVVDVIGPNPITIPKILERVRDVEHLVRLAAYRKCSKIGPKLLRISDRQSILSSGFNETHKLVKICFTEELLPKWLSAYNGDYLKLLNALKLDAYEEDIRQTESICKNILEVFFKSEQLTDIIQYLPIDEARLIPLEKLCYEASLYWCILTNYLRKIENAEDYIENVLPELSPFCIYIEMLFQEKSKQKLKEWEYFEYQYILLQLLQIAGKYDLSDEVGRQTLHNVIVNMLTHGTFIDCVLSEMIGILEKMKPGLDALTVEICHIISDIREPLTVQQPSEDVIRQRNFKLAEVRVKINILNGEQEEAVQKCNYESAAILEKQLTQLRKELDEMNAKFESEKQLVRSQQSDSDVICQCLNILIAMLSCPNLKTVTAALRSCKDEFVLPLMDHNNMDINSKAYKCLILYCLLDKQLAVTHLKYIITPIIVYQLIQQYNKDTLLVCIAAISDLLRLFGTTIFRNDEVNTTKNGSRRLYRNLSMSSAEEFNIDNVTCKDITDILLDMLDDECEEIGEQAGKALSELVLSGIAVTPILMSKLILTWFNPITEKHNQKLQQLLGHTFLFFSKYVEGSEEILEKTVVHVLSSLGNAPRTSPLADIDTDNALRFLASITAVQKSNVLVDTHKNLAFHLCHKISSNHNDVCVPLYIRMLLHLEIVVEDAVVIRELINQVQLMQDDIVSKMPKKNVEKFLSKLNRLLASIMENQESVQIETTAETTALSVATSNINKDNDETGATESIATETSTNCSLPNRTSEKHVVVQTNTKSNENVRIKRRKSRGKSRNTSQISNSSNETVLNTIIEDDNEPEILKDEDLVFKTPSTGSSSSSLLSLRNRTINLQEKVIISETSSESEGPQKKAPRRSKRKIKRKVVL